MSFSEKDKQLLSSASADVIIPENIHLPLAEVLKTYDEFASIYGIKQREFLFFGSSDERLTAYVLLRIPQCPEDQLKLYLSRLNLKVEVWISSHSQLVDRTSSGTTATRELVFTEVIKYKDDPIVLISQSEDDPMIFLNLVWEVSIALKRPRTRFQSTYATLIPIAQVSPAEHTTLVDSYLEPFQPQVGNLFEALRGSRGYEKGVPYLPVSRLDAVPPQTPEDELAILLPHTQSQPLPIHQALVTRLRCSKAIVDDAVVSMVASLDIEVAPLISIRGRIESCQATLQRGTVCELMDDMLPMACQSRDCITLLYRLKQAFGVQSGGPFIEPARSDNLSMTIKIRLELAEMCQPEINTHFTANVDFVSSLNQLPGSTRFPTHTPSQSTSLQFISKASNPNLVTVSFTAVDTFVQVGAPFVWRVLVVNNSSKAAKLAIIPLPRLPKPTSQIQQYAKKHATRSSIASQSSDKNFTDKVQTDIAQAVIDENIIYAMQHSGVVPADTDLISLTPELRVGPLAPGQCHEGEIRFVAFKAGAFMLDAIRIVDLVKEAEQGFSGAGVVTDIRELPDVIVQDG